MRYPLAYLSLAALALTLAVAPAGSPSPSPSPSPRPSAGAKTTSPPTATPAATGVPVIVYPFTSSSGLPAKTGADIAGIYVNVFQTSGGIDVLPAPGGGTTPQLQLALARKAHADYYVTGYLTPLGDGVSMVAQVISSETGLLLYSKTVQLTGANDAAAEAVVARQAVLAYSGTNDLEAAQAGVSGSPTPTPQASNAVGLGNLLTLFKRTVKTTPTPSPTPAIKPKRIVIVTHMSGSGIAPAQLTEATNALSAYLYRHFTIRSTAATIGADGAGADAICGTDRDATIAAGRIDQQGGRHPKTTATLTLFTCFGAKLYTGTSTNDNLNRAIETAVDTYATAHPANS